VKKRQRRSIFKSSEGRKGERAVIPRKTNARAIAITTSAGMVSTEEIITRSGRSDRTGKKKRTDTNVGDESWKEKRD